MNMFSVWYEVDAKSLQLKKILFTKLKMSKRSQKVANTKHVFC